MNVSLDELRARTRAHVLALPQGAQSEFLELCQFSRTTLNDFLKGATNLNKENRENLRRAIEAGEGRQMDQDGASETAELIRLIADEMEVIVTRLRSDIIPVESKADTLAKRLSDIEALAKDIRKALG